MCERFRLHTLIKQELFLESIGQLTKILQPLDKCFFMTIFLGNLQKIIYRIPIAADRNVVSSLTVLS